MNYFKHYEELIERARGRKLKQYTEKHHIWPKCIGGNNNYQNIVELTPEEHYVAHQLLVKMFPWEEGLIFACFMMTFGSHSKHNRNNKDYGWIRKRLSESHKDSWAKKKGFENYYEQCFIVWDYFVNKDFDTKSISKKLGIGINNVNSSLNFFAAKMNLENELTKSRKNKRSKLSKEIRANISEEQEEKRKQKVKEADHSGRKGKRYGSNNPNYGNRYKHQIVKCPYCGTEGGISTTKRWHFENCKWRK